MEGADWVEFSNKIGEELQKVDMDQSVKALTEDFNRLVLAAAYKHVGPKAIGMNRRSWLTREIAAEINTRNDMRKEATLALTKR